MKDKCEKYGRAITNYVLDEAMGMTKEELFEHLKVCKDCRRDLTEWRDTHTVMKTEAYYQTPEGKAKMKRSFEDVKRQVAGGATVPPRRDKLLPQPEKAPLNAKVEIDSAAEAIYKFVKDYTGGSSDKKVAIPVIRNETELFDYPFYESIGCLVTNEKLNLTKDKNNRPVYVSAR